MLKPARGPKFWQLLAVQKHWDLTVDGGCWGLLMVPIEVARGIACHVALDGATLELFAA